MAKPLRNTTVASVPKPGPDDSFEDWRVDGSVWSESLEAVIAAVSTEGLDQLSIAAITPRLLAN